MVKSKLKKALEELVIVSKRGKVNNVKSLKQVYEKWLDKLWKLLIHVRDEGCQWCKKIEGKMDAHHIFHKGKNVRWNPDNGMKLCYYCHHWRLRKEPETLLSLIVAKIGMEKFNKLNKESKSSATNIELKYKKIEEQLLSKLKELNITAPKRPKHLSKLDNC